MNQNSATTVDVSVNPTIGVGVEVRPEIVTPPPVVNVGAVDLSPLERAQAIQSAAYTQGNMALAQGIAAGLSAGAGNLAQGFASTASGVSAGLKEVGQAVNDNMRVLVLVAGAVALLVVMRK